MIKTVIFDLDGTLLNTLDDLRNGVNIVLRKRGYPERTLDEIRRFVGNGVKKLVERALPEGKSEEEKAACLAEFKEAYNQCMAEKTAPFDGICELLKALKAKDIHVAVLSNKHDAAAKALCESYFGSLVDFTLGERPGVPTKPAPDAVFDHLKHFGSAKAETLYVGDTDVDMQTAKAAGLYAVGVSWGFRDKDVIARGGADIIIDSPMELLEVIKCN